jgi:hypothetical protein
MTDPDMMDSRYNRQNLAVQFWIFKYVDALRRFYTYKTV